MSGFLRIVGIVNAAIWFGAGIFFAAVILPSVFSGDMHKLFNETGTSYYSGGVAQILFRHYFVLQYVCGVVAVLHLLAEKLYLGRALPKLGTMLVVAMLGLGLIGGVAVEPHMESLRQTKYFGQTQEQKEAAGRSFGLWHGMSQVANLFILCGLLAHLIRVTRPAGPSRYGNFYQIP